MSKPLETQRVAILGTAEPQELGQPTLTEVVYRFLESKVRAPHAERVPQEAIC